GLSMLLRGLKRYTSNLTAIVTVADDGGSTGRLRQEFGVIAPGDLRQCIAALAEAEPLMSRLFQYRFKGGNGLEGHSFGNLFIVAMADVTGNFETAIHETSRVLNTRGTILPSTLEDVTLSARTSEDEVVHGESNITEKGGAIREVFLNPVDADAHPDAVRAVLDADMIVIGPGSLYTSVLPNLLVRDLQKALLTSTATRVFVCNVATQHGETDGFNVSDHVKVIEAHTQRGIVQAVVANNNIVSELPESWQSNPVRVNGAAEIEEVRLVEADVVAEQNRYRHDPDKLAATILRLYDGRSALVTDAPRAIEAPAAEKEESLAR
ncbi:MAG: gluconeogenesis factor YvcK family protein, partial [Tepidiformaceae bacterium]